MKPLSLTAIISPAPAIILMYLDDRNMKRKRLIPVRYNHYPKDKESDGLESILDDLIRRHSPLASVEKKEIMKCLRVLKLVISGQEINEAIREVSKDFFDGNFQKRIKRVSFKEGPHDVQEISDDDGDHHHTSEGLHEIVNYHLDLPEDDDDDDEEVMKKGMEDEDPKVETNFSWIDEDGDFVF